MDRIIYLLFASLFLLEYPRQIFSYLSTPIYVPLVRLESFLRTIFMYEDMLKFALQHSFFNYVYVDVPFYDDAFRPKTIVINKGKEHGLDYGCAVVFGSALVGKISEVQDNFSLVLTLYHPKFKLHALAKHSRIEGILEGGIDPKFTFLEGYTLLEGDTLITSGKDALLPYGLCVGIVESVDSYLGGFLKASVKPCYPFGVFTHFLVLYNCR